MKFARCTVGLLGLTALLFTAGDANAWCGFKHCCHHKHHCFETHITCRPYNAFTPICWGNLYCDGCCPNPCAAAGGCLPMSTYAGGYTMGAPYAGYPMGGLPVFASTPYDATPGSFPNNGIPQTAPTQMPSNVPVPVNTTMYGNPMYGYPGSYYVQPASFYPGYYYPMGYYPNYSPLPYSYGNYQQRPY